MYHIGGEKMRVDKECLCELLNIKIRTLKKIESEDKLSDRLNVVGYNLIEKVKNGRKVYYILEEKEVDLYTEYGAMINEVYCSNDKDDSFTKYFPMRNLANDVLPISEKDLARYCNVNINTIRKWNNRLIELNILVKDDYYYICIDYEKNEIYQADKEAYNSYWKNIRISTVHKKLEEKFLNNEISFLDAMEISQNIGAVRSAIEKRYYYRIKKYKTNSNNTIYIKTMDIIKMLYYDTYIKPIEDILDSAKATFN